MDNKKLKIGVSFWGQPRIIPHAYENYINTIKDDTNEFYIMYSTWNSESTQEFIKYFPNVYIRQYDVPDIDKIYELKNVLDNYRIDPTNSHNGKNLKHYLMGLYIKKASKETIESFEKDNNIKFDIIISLRTDTNIFNGNLKLYYNRIITSDAIFVANEPRFDIYSNGSAPDVIMIAKSDNLKKALCHLDVIKKTNVCDTNFFHPETSFLKSLKALDFEVINLNFNAFPKSHSLPKR